MIVKIFKYFFSVALICSYYLCYGAQIGERVEPQERLEVIDGKIEESKRKSLEEERAIKKAEDELRKYKQNLKDAQSPEQKKRVEEKISIAQKTRDTASENKSKEDTIIKKLVSEKETVEALQKSLVAEASSTGQGQESLVEEQYKRCIEEKIAEYFELKKERTTQSQKKALEQLGTAIKKLISYEWVTFANSDTYTQPMWEAVREKALKAKPGDKSYDATYKKLLDDVTDLKAGLERLTGKKLLASPGKIGIDCSFGYFATKTITKKILETVDIDAGSGYDM